MIQLQTAPAQGKINVPVITASLIQKFLFVLISVVVIMYSLGYRVNFETYTVQQTGLISLDTDLAGLKPTVEFNNKKVDQPFPMKFSWLFPDTYTVRVEKEGYQTWERVITVEENRAYVYNHVLLVHSQPKTVPMTEQYVRELSSYRPDTTDLRIKENELWRKDKLLKRTSDDIHAAQWYPDGDHIVSQVGSKLVINDDDGKGTLTIGALPTDQTAAIAFADHGRIVLVRQGAVSQAFELYETPRWGWPLTVLR